MSLFRQLLDFLLPSSCSYCREPVGDSRVPHFCRTCWNDFDPIAGPVCSRCGRPFDSSEILSHSPAFHCSSCRTSPPLFDQALSVGYFEGPLREAIHQFKYRPCRSLGAPLGAWMVDRVRTLLSIDMVMPVPLHPKRLRQRGFNQALLLAYCVNVKYGIPLVYDNLTRTRPTRPQVELIGVERVKNVAGAFSLRFPKLVENKHILLIDDVFTTGATMNECAAILKRAGADQVTACTLARAI
jgi:ComF family protein